MNHIVQEIVIILEENAKLKSALGFYAYEARDHVVMEMNGQRMSGIKFAADAWGDKARECLKSIGLNKHDYFEEKQRKEAILQHIAPVLEMKRK
jgi:hypothetical protein